MKTIHGFITSAGKMDRTITVTTHRYETHPVYGKRFRVSKKFLVDTNDHKDLDVGDEVIIKEMKPMSKRKHFKLEEVVKRAPRTADMREEVIPEAKVSKPGAATSEEKSADDAKSTAEEKSKNDSNSAQ